MCIGATTNSVKVGNLMVLLANRLSPLYHTKLIKLLYLIDEEAVKDNGIPITWLDYRVWRHGPVNQETFIASLNKGVFKEYVKSEKDDYGNLITPLVEFNDDEFSPYDFEIINKTIDKYGKMNTDQIIGETHKEGSLWKKIVDDNGLEFNKSATSPHFIDFKQLISGDNIKSDNYEGAREIMLLSSH